MFEKFNRLSKKERTQIYMLLGFSLLAAYTFYAAKTWEEMFNTEKLANRKADRIEKRIGEIKAPELEEGISQSSLDVLLKDIDQQEKALRTLAKPLLPSADSSAREELKLEITQLANLNGLKLESLSSQQFLAGSALNLLTGKALREYFNARPSFNLKMQGSYFDLIGFIEGLENLDYQVYASSLDISHLGEEKAILDIKLELKL